MTDATLERLREAGVPADVVGRLAKMKRENVKGRGHGRGLIEDYLGGEDAGRYADVVLEHMEPLEPQGIIVRDAEGHERRVYGLFAALSFDEGETWPVKKLLTPGGTPRVIDCYGWVEDCYVDDTHAEIGGYLAEAQTPDGTIHLLSSGLHYRFNLPWLLEPMPAGECGKFGEFGKGRAGAEWVEWEERGEWGVWEGRRGV